jgi:hypothetical protein
MKYLSFIFVILMAAACQNGPQPSASKDAGAPVPSTGNFGETVGTIQATPAANVAALFTSSDTIAATVNGNIKASCRHSGCWMDLDMGNGETVHVTFKDESFTIPLDAAGKNAIAQGTAIRELITVEMLQNYAREDGKSDEEIAAITEPVYAYEFIADGVLIEE